MRRAVHLYVSGRVQGVWYRGAMAREAARLGIDGWCRNLADGRVEAVVQGPADAVALIVAWCGQGPSGARVMDVQSQDVAAAERSRFEIR